MYSRLFWYVGVILLLGFPTLSSSLSAQDGVRFSAGLTWRLAHSDTTFRHRVDLTFRGRKCFNERLCGAVGVVTLLENALSFTNSGNNLVHAGVGAEVRVGKFWILPSLVQSFQSLPDGRIGYYRGLATGVRIPLSEKSSIIAEVIFKTFDVSCTKVHGIRDFIGKVHYGLLDFVVMHTSAGGCQRGYSLWTPELLVRIPKTPLFASGGWSSVTSLTLDRNIAMAHLSLGVRFGASSR